VCEFYFARQWTKLPEVARTIWKVEQTRVLHLATGLVLKLCFHTPPHSVFVSAVPFLQPAAIISLYIIRWFTFVIEAHCVLREVQKISYTKIYIDIILQNVNKNWPKLNICIFFAFYLDV
jgi:hypothetical protein